MEKERDNKKFLNFEIGLFSKIVFYYIIFNYLFIMGMHMTRQLYFSLWARKE